MYISPIMKDQLSIGIFDENNKPICATLSHDFTTKYEVTDCPDPL